MVDPQYIGTGQMGGATAVARAQKNFLANEPL